MNRAPSIVLCLAMLVSAPSAHTHSLGRSFSQWRVDGETTSATFTLPLATLELLAPLLRHAEESSIERVTDHLHERFAMKSARGCTLVDGPRTTLSPVDALMQVRWTWHCTNRESLEIRNDALFAFDPGHTHIARVNVAGGVRERVLSADDREWSVALTSEAGASSGFLDYFRLGVAHIATGYDHLAFLAAVMLAVIAARRGRVRDVVWVVSGFTLGHSMTLALGVLGWVRPDGPAVEGLIGFTIVLVCVEPLLAHGRAARVVLGVPCALLACAAAASIVNTAISWWALLGLALFSASYLALLHGEAVAVRRYHAVVTALFGLVHGFGFAGTLMEAQLPPTRLASALLGFNLGVEAGQLIVVAILIVLVRQMGRTGPLAGHATAVTSGLLCALGTYWFVARTFSM
ncbi:MAG: HupE/UreJ family protein [Gammaproteobacteria bacterium]